MENENKITQEKIQAFFDGRDPMEHIIKIECSYDDEKATIIYRRDDGAKRIKKEAFHPFVWAKQIAGRELFGGDRELTKKKLSDWGIECKGLRISRDDGTVPQRMADGYRVLFRAKGAMSYSKFMRFFKEGGVPIYPTQRDKNYGRRDYIAVSPVEQFMIATGKRQFKGYDDYDDLVRMPWDLETTGLNPQKDSIDQIGIRTNKGFEKIIKVKGEGEEKRKNEIAALREFFQTIKEVQPDVVTGHNTENFDWNFDDVRLEPLGGMVEVSSEYLPRGVYKKKKQQVLKLGGEMEYYFPTVMWGHILTDSLFAVRRAMAIDSNIKSANLKYITKFSGLNKPNRVYIPGKQISTVSHDTDNAYLFDNSNGKWMKYDKSKGYVEEDGFVVNPKTGERFTIVTGEYIGERYLLDDLYETDKVELQYNQSNFLVAKMLPVPFEKVCTMGTAAIWKYIMLAWSYENDLAIPQIISKRPFVGGLSRLIKVGYVADIVKLDYNSLYPSIILTFCIKNDVDVMDVLLLMLEYVLSKREHYKELKAIHGIKVDELKELLAELQDAKRVAEVKNQISDEKKLKNAANTLQLPLKILGNSYFGGSSSGTPFPWTDTNCIGPEQTTCTGRQMLRLMIYHFSNISKFNNANLSDDYNYTPVVGDSVTYDTPIFIRRLDDLRNIDIVPICDIFDDNGAIRSENDQYRDFSNKPFEVLTRNGWKPIKYIYKHKTDKQLRRIETKNGLVDCTEDHSLFDNDGNEVKPSQLNRGDGIEIYKGKVDYHQLNMVTKDEAWLYGFFMADGSAFYGDRTQKYYSKRKKQIVEHRGKRANWKISNQSLERLEKAQKIITDVFGVKSSIKDHNKSSGVYNLVVESAIMASWFADHFYTSYREKKIPSLILNTGSLEVKKAFLDGFCCGDGQGDTIDECIEFGQKSKVAMAGLYFLLKELNYNFRCHNRKDKPSFLSFRLRNHRGNLLNENYSKRSEEKVWSNNEITSKNEFVYDISADGTFVNALGMIVCHNTDGFNFQKPKKYRYTAENPYIGKGLGRNVKKDKAYTMVDADVAEFEDTYLNTAYNGGVLKNGLGIDEECVACIQFSRKNYADLMPDGSIKLVGNTIKSKKMPKYIEKFLADGIRMLLEGRGRDFIESYYDYIEKIYNLQIPLRDIATIGKIKTNIESYKASCNELTAAGNKKARQAWYELVIKNNLKVDMGDSIYYINTGTKKGDSDVKRVTHYFATIDGQETDVSKELERLYNKEKKQSPDKMKDENGKWIKKNVFGRMKYGQTFKEQDEIIFNCVLLPNDVVEDDDDHYCDDSFEYNVAKYIEMFNKRIRPLLVCFSRDIRTSINEKGKEIDNILITNPKDRKMFTEEECQLVAGQPYNKKDQDTYEELMTMEDKEIKFWLLVDKEPPYTKECGMDWEEIKKDYLERMKVLEQEEIKKDVEAYNKAIDALTESDVNAFLEDGVTPESILAVVDEDANSNNFISKKHNVVIGNIFDIIDKVFDKNEDDEDDV